MTHNIFNTLVPHNTDSDESDGDEMLPMGAFWPAPEDEKWTMVERSHGSGEKLDHSGMRCGQLDYIEETDNRGTRSEVLLSKQREATQYNNTPPGVEPSTESAIASVNRLFVNDRM